MKTLSSSQPFCRFSSKSTAAFSALCLFAAVAIPATVFGQGAPPAQPSAPAGTRVAVIDVSYVFKNHPGFKAAMEGMKGDVQAFEAKLQARGKEMQALQQQLGQYKPTSADYKAIETKIIQLNAGGQADATVKKKEFLEQEAAIYYATYKEIVAEVATLAERHGIGLVVRFNSEPINAEQRPSVLEGVNRAVVFQKNLNITYAVLERLKAKSVATPPGAAPTTR